MSLTATSVIEVNTTALASDTAASGAFDSSNAGSLGNDMTYGSTAAVVSGAASSSNTTTVTATWATASMQGNALYVPGYGTAIITAVSAGVSFTINAAIGTFTSVTSYVGGPLASLGAASAIIAVGNFVWIGAGNYAFTSTTDSVSGGVFVSPGGIMLQGYDVTRGDNTGTRPTIDFAAFSTLDGIVLDTGRNTIANISMINGNAGWGNPNVLCRGSGCVVDNCVTLGGTFYLQYATARRCFASGANAYLFPIVSASLIECVGVATSSTYGLFNMFPSQGNTTVVFDRCIQVNGRFDIRGTTCVLKNCVAYNDSSGFMCLVAAGSQEVENCIFYTTYASETGIGGGGNAPYSYSRNNAFLGASPNIGSGVIIPGNITGTIQLTVNPFVNPTATINSWADAQAAFALNTTAGGGALCRGAGTPQYLDIGATQHQDSGGGGVPRIVVPRRMW